MPLQKVTKITLNEKKCKVKISCLDPYVIEIHFKT